MDPLLFYLLAASGVSFLWLLLTGHRRSEETPFIGAIYLIAIVAQSALLFYLWQRNVGLSVILGAAHGLLSAVFWLSAPQWNTRGHVFLTAFTGAQLVFLARIGSSIITGGLPPLFVTASLLLFLAELLVVGLTVYFAYEVLDVMCRVRWDRHFRPLTGDNDYWPKVSIHVPAHAEPPEMVIETLNALRNLDYPSYEVIMVDDNTDDDVLWRPVLDYCHEAGIKVFHLQNYPGFKSGALNFALTQTAPDAEIIAVVDSDYVVRPNYLRETIPYFRNTRVAFVQTPQSFRNRAENRFAEYSALSQRFFFEISMRSRNEQNAIIFCGTMGLIRKRVLERIGGWDEWCITEDAEASLRMLNKGYQGVYINQPYGDGLLPAVFEDTKKQRFRWAFGGMQILRRYWRWLILGRTERGPTGLTRRQRLIYLMGLLGWLNDLLVLIFTLVLLLTAAAFAFGWNLPVRRLTEWILLVPIVSFITGLLRVAWALRRSTGCDWRAGFGAFMSMLALGWTVAQACLKALRHDSGVFLRTPKVSVDSDLSRALRTASWEAVLGLILAAAAPIVLYVRADRQGLMLGALLAWHAFVYLAALRSALIEALPARPASSRSGAGAG